MPKVLITGANGLLGQHLTTLLSGQKDWDILATARGANRLPFTDGYRYRSLDITKEAEVQQLFAEEQPDYVIHGAAMTQVDACELHPGECWQTNVEATHALWKAARAAGAFFAFISTDFIFDGQAGPYQEEALPNPVNYYGLSKLAAEMLLKGSEGGFAILRTILVYGVPADLSRSNIVLWVKKSLEEGKTIQVVDDQWRTPTLVQDLAAGCLQLLKKREAAAPLSTVYNLSGKDLLTPYAMALQIADHFGLDASLIVRADGSMFSQTAKRPARTGFVLTRAEKELGYRPHSFSEGLAVVQKLLSQADLP